MSPSVEVLIKILKSEIPSIRQDMAKELGKLQVENAIRPLIKMANGGSRKFFAKYDLDDQMAAIRALAETGSRKALMFIERINASKTSYSNLWDWTYDQSPSQNHPTLISTSSKTRYLYAKGALKRELEKNEITARRIDIALERIKETVAEREKREEKIKILIKNIKSDDVDVRRNAATELGKMQVEGAVNSLIEMANGGDKLYRKPEYYLEDEVIAIKALAETGSITASEYLKQINTIDEILCEDYNDDSLNPKFWGTYTRTIDSGYIYVTGFLRDKLSIINSKPDHNNEYVKIIESALERIKETVAGRALVIS